MMIRPYGKRLLIEIVEEEHKKGSLILIKENKEICSGVVLDWGDDCESTEWNCGVHIMFKRYAVTSTIDPGLFLVNEDDVLAIIEE